MCDCNCNKPKCGPAPLQPVNVMLPTCEDRGVIFHTQIIPASMGTSAEGQPYAPKTGMYKNMLVRYEADKAIYLYDSDGVYSCLRDAEEV